MPLDTRTANVRLHRGVVVSSLINVLALQEKYETFLLHPTADRYLDLRATIIDEFGCPEIAPIVALERQIPNSNDAFALERCIDGLSCVWFLSPRFHQLVAQISRRHSAQQQRELSLFEAQCCLKALLATGDGTFDHPFVSTYATDIRDVASALDIEVQGQHVCQNKTDWYDVASCEDRELWFRRPAFSPIAVPDSIASTTGKSK